MKVKYNIGFFLLLSAYGCSVYSPQLVDIPLISEKNELRLDAGFNWLNLFYGSLSYGLTKSIALQTFYDKDAEGMYYFQNAAGYYRKMGRGAVTEIWGGYGFGYTDIGNHDVPTRLKGSYSITFAQFNIGRKDIGKAHADYGIGIKGGWWHSDLTDINYFSHINYPSPTPPAKQVNIDCFIFEPNAFLRLGGEHLKFSLKVGFCDKVQNTSKESPLPVEKANFAVGLNYKF